MTTTAHTTQAVYKGETLLGFAVRTPAGEIVAKFRHEDHATDHATALDIRDALALTDSRTDSGLPLELCLKMGRDPKFCALVFEIMERPELENAIRHECRALDCMA